MATEGQVLILRDDDGTFYVITPEAIEAAKVPAEKRQLVEEAVSGDVSGFLFNDFLFQTAFTNLTQSNSAFGQNTLIGGVNVLSPQTINQLQSNVANINTSQSGRF
jgi:hypothetical protein